MGAVRAWRTHCKGLDDASRCCCWNSSTTALLSCSVLLWRAKVQCRLSRFFVIMICQQIGTLVAFSQSKFSVVGRETLPRLERLWRRRGNKKKKRQPKRLFGDWQAKFKALGSWKEPASLEKHILLLPPEPGVILLCYRVLLELKWKV